jgi:hypothetical protein
VPVFLERFLIPALATGLISVIIINPLKLSWQQQAQFAIAVIAVAYLAAHVLHKRAGVSRIQLAIKQESFGDSSANVVGNQNMITSGDGRSPGTRGQ